MTGIFLVLQKDLLLLWRTRARVVAVMAFGVTSLLLFSFAAGPDTTRLKANASGYLWLAILLCSTLSLSESFRIEMQNRALEGLRLLPTEARAIFFGKSLANLLVLLILGIALIPAMVLLYDVGFREGLPMMISVIFLGAAGISAPGTLYGLLSARVRSGEVLLPLLLFPLEVPALLASSRSTDLVINGDPMGQLQAWMGLLVAFNLIFWSVCGLLFGRLLEE
jgi:heme exporter protein B